MTERTRLRRLPEKAVADVAVLHAILDAARVAHVGFADEEGRPVVIPTGAARDGDRLLLHGSSGAGLLRAAAAGGQIAVAVTHVDGLVYATSLFDSSMNYRSAVVLGTASVLEGDQRLDALRTLSEHLMPGRWDEVRPPTGRELAATLVLALPLDEVSVKVRTGGPSGAVDEIAGWAGVLPLGVHTGKPVAADGVSSELPLPSSIHLAQRRHPTPPQSTTIKER